VETVIIDGRIIMEKGKMKKDIENKVSKEIKKLV